MTHSESVPELPPEPPADSLPESASTGSVPSSEDVVINVQQLFAGRREIALELEGVRYKLRITRKNKLILQK
jgi:hemin uptake protein HemP